MNLRGEWWWCEYELAGKRERVPLRTTDVASARKERDTLLAAAKAIREGRPIPVVRTWTDAVNEWLGWIDTAPRVNDESRKRYKCSVRVWSDIFGPGDGRPDTPLADITDETLIDFVKERRLDGRSASTIRNDLTALSSVLKRAMTRKWLAVNVAAAFDRAEEIGKSKDDVLSPPTDAELAADLVEIAEWREDMSLLLRWLRETGMRLREALYFRRDYVHPDGTEATLLTGTKGNKPRTIALGRAADLLPSLPTSGRIFPGLHLDSAVVSTRYGQWRRQRQARENQAALDEGREPVILRRWRLHDLRHAYACASLIDDKTALYSLQQQLGHSTVGVTERYVRFLDGGGAMRKHGRRRDLFGSLSDAREEGGPHKKSPQSVLTDA
jgi:integrase/recombinase XerD